MKLGELARNEKLASRSKKSLHLGDRTHEEGDDSKPEEQKLKLMIHFVWMPQAHGVVRGYLLADWDVAPLIRLALHEGARKNIYIIKNKKKKKRTGDFTAASCNKRGCTEAA